MKMKVQLNYLRISPRKVRLAADLIRGKSVKEAENILNFTVKKSSLPLLKLLKAAIANAQNNFQLDANNLYISEIIVDEGPKLKRWRPRARGQAYEIQKKTSHISLTLDEKIKTEKKTLPAKKVKKSKAAKEKTLVKEKLKEKVIKSERPKPKPKKIEVAKPKTEKGVIKKIFRRKAF